MTSPPTIALSARWSAPPDRFRWLAGHGFAMDYAPNPAAFETLPEQVAPLLAAGVPVRYHGFFPAHEFAHRDPDRAEAGLCVHLAALEAMAGRGQPVITFHIGLRQPDQIDPGRAVENLSRLVEYARPRGITVCLENLRTGPTSQAQTLAGWARASGAMITFDVGHAVSCAPVQRGELSPLDFLNLVADRLRHVHIYERETDRHYPPQDMTILSPIVDRLLTTPCRWWTIELDDRAEALATRSLLLAYLDRKPAPSP